MKTNRLNISPHLLTWARQEAGFSIAHIADKLGQDPETIIAWEEGLACPTEIQARHLCHVLSRPFALLFLERPPARLPKMRDFRRFPAKVHSSDDYELGVEIRRAHLQRDWLLARFEALEEPIPNIPLLLTEDNSPRALANAVVNAFDLDSTAIFDIPKGYPSFHYWRQILESHGILIFQFTGIDLELARGFSHNFDELPFIGLNRSDHINARIFTMFHELGHLLRHTSGLCNSDLASTNIEKECNAFAGEFLVPSHLLMNESELTANLPSSEWTDKQIIILASKYSVSREVIVRRLFDLGLTSKVFYETKRREYEEQFRSYRERERERRRLDKSKGGPDPATTAVDSAGRHLASIIVEGILSGDVPLFEASRILNVKVKHLDRITDMVMSW